MVKTFSTLCALGFSVAAAFAQAPASPAAPALPPGIESKPGANTPAPIDPPIQLAGVPQQAAAPAPGTPEPAVPGLPVPTTNGNGLSPTTTRLNEFQGDEIGLVLRTLARQAKMNVVISDKVATTAGTVTMRIEDRTPKEAIDIIVTSKGLVMDELNGVHFIKTQEERAKEPTESGNYTFSYAQAKDVLALLQGQLQSGTAPQVDTRTNTIFYREAKSNMAKVKSFLSAVDRPTQQVMIEARLVEVTANPQQAYGINWGGVFGGPSSPQTFRYGGSGPDGLGAPKANKPKNSGPNIDTTDGTLGSVIVDEQAGILKPFDQLLNAGLDGGFGDALAGQFAILSVPQMSATLRLLNEDKDAEFLANPRVVTASNQKAEIKITRNQPVPQLNFNEQTAQAVFSGFQDKEFGNTLSVTPSINKDDFISMLVKPEISNKVGDATFTFSGATVTSPVIDKRTLESNVLIKSGDTLAIGGLLQDESTKGRTKVPILGDVPILGYLFQERINTRTKRNLLVFVTPTIIKQGYGTGLESQVVGLENSGEEVADPNGWRNNARGVYRLVPTSNRQLAADYPVPGLPSAKKTATKTTSKSGGRH
jgi:type IV pilus secretin PilQ/predicted competence protein